MSDVLTAILYVSAHYFHLVTTTLLVGGTCFYLLIVPRAIDELREESQRIVFARARWLFRNVVLPSVVLLLITGAVLTVPNLWIYRGQQIHLFREMARLAHPDHPSVATLDDPSIFSRPAVWFILHAVVGIVTIVIAVLLVRGMIPPAAPLPWMRLNLFLLLVTILLACMTRNARQHLFESIRPKGPIPAGVTNG